MYQVVGYHRPTSLPQALQLLDSGRRVAIAGGVHLRHDGGAEPTEIVDLQATDLDSIAVDDSTATIGATVRLQTLADDSRLPQVIRAACKAEQPSTLRTLATLGGTVAVAAGDSLLLATLLAHDAVVRLVSEAHGERSTPLGDLLTDGRRPGELIVDVTIHTSGTAAIARTGRTPCDTPIVAVVGRRHGDSTTLGLCGVAAAPLRLTPEELASLQPISDHRATAEYRTHLAQVLTGRVLEQLP